MIKYLVTPSLLLCAAVLAAPLSRSAGAVYYAFYGDNNAGAGKGISVGLFNTDTGAISPAVIQSELRGPSFFVVSADGKHLYSVAEGGNSVNALEVDAKTGALKLLNSTPAGGSGPCHVALDKTGKYLAVANYNDGTVAVFPIEADGSIGAHTAFDQHTGGSRAVPARQAGPHAHFVTFDPSNKFLLNCDLGQDKVYVYKFDDKTGKITPNDPPTAALPPGVGPRHLVFAPNGKFVYVTSEMGNTVTALTWDAAKGTLTPFQTVTPLASGDPGKDTGLTDAEITMDAKGKFLYASVRDVDHKGRDNVAVFSVADDGKLTKVQDVTVGSVPRFITFDPTGKWLLVPTQDGNTVQVYSVDTTTGKLTAKGDPISTPAPVCIQFVAVPADAKPIPAFAAAAK